MARGFSLPWLLVVVCFCCFGSDDDYSPRASLESIGAELAVIKHTVPLTQLRIQQARVRTGLDALLSPAQVEMDEVVKCVSEIGRQVRMALDRLGQC